MKGCQARNSKERLAIHFLFFCFVFLFQCSKTGFPTGDSEKNLSEPFLPLVTTGLGSYLSTSRFDQFAEQNIEWNRFLGTWQEMKRIDNLFQQGLTNVSAEYQLLGDGNIRVINQGTNPNGVSRLEGIALLPNPNIGKLKVSFLYPFFFGDYLILKIDRTNYQTALIGGPEANFLWIFSREKTISPAVETEYIQYARTIGYDTNRLLAY